MKCTKIYAPQKFTTHLVVYIIAVTWAQVHGLPDMCTQGPRVSISGRPQLLML